MASKPQRDDVKSGLLEISMKKKMYLVQRRMQVKKVEESGSGATTRIILSLRESLQNCKDNPATCQE